MSTTHIKTRLRIIAAIAGKDISDAVKNRTTLSIMLGTLVLMLSSLALPLLLQLRATPTAIVYDPGRSTLIRAMTTREEFRLGIVDTFDELGEVVGSASGLRLGLVIPEGFGQAASESSGSEGIVLTGHVPHWAKPDQVAELVAFFEEQFEEASWREISIDVADERMYPVAGKFGQHALTANTMSMIVLTVGLALAPSLLVDEKESHTLDALLVSPARYGQIVLGKAITGLFYCVCAALIIYILSARWFVSGWLLVLALSLGIAFAVLTGLLMGLLVENPNSVNLWTGLLLMLLLVPGLLGGVLGDRGPAALRAIMRWIPTSAFSEMLTLTTLRSAPVSDWIWPAARLAGGVLIVAGLIVWRVRRADR